MIAVLVLAAAAAPALAQDQSINLAGSRKLETTIENVSFAGLDLATDRGQRRLSARIHAAADRVCTGNGELWNAFTHLEYRRCYTQAEATAVRQASKIRYASAN
jgi:UrcA family protein